MRTTVDLPEAVHRRAVQLAASRRQSLSSLIAEMTIRGMALSGEPVVISRSQHSGFPTIDLAPSVVTSDDVADALDDE